MRGFYVTFGHEIDPAVNAAVHDLTRALLADLPSGVTDLIPSYASLYVEFSPALTSERALRAQIARAPRVPAAGARHHELPVAYVGPDLAEVAAATGLSVQEVIDLHSGADYRVYTLGFTPGFPYLGPLPQALRLPRLATPRAHVPAHSVAIADAQTGVYPVASPGGWHLLGTALQAVYDPSRAEPFLLEPGDSVRFVPAQGEAPPPTRPVELLPEHPRHPALRVLQPGLQDLLVDEGRLLMGRYGLARSGALDQRSARLANRLLGNSPSALLIELSLHGPVLEVTRPLVLALAGYGLSPVLNGSELEPFTSFQAPAGSVLTFKPTPDGARAYLAVAGGFESRRFLGSASVDLRAGIGRPLAAGDMLGVAEPKGALPGFSFRPHRRASGATWLRLLPGPQWNQDAAHALSEGRFRVASADRMGIRLAGGPVPGGQVLSEAAPIGALQVTPGGTPLLLLADRGTVGGYAKPALLHPGDLPKAGQLRTGEWVRFRIDRSVQE